MTQEFKWKQLQVETPIPIVPAHLDNFVEYLKDLNVREMQRCTENLKTRLDNIEKFITNEQELNAKWIQEILDDENKG